MKKTFKIFCEVGLNHMGKEEYLNKYLNVLLDENIDGITVQLPKKSFYEKNKKYNKFKLKNKTILKFLNQAKKLNKEVGLATNDISLAKFFKKKIDFIKILSQDFSNINLLKSFNVLNLNLYLSVGLNNIKDIEIILNSVNSKKFFKRSTLVHTSFDKKINKRFNKNFNEDFSLKRIRILKNKFKLKVGFSNHFKNLKKISESLKYKPDVVFFYVKLNKKLNFPDKDWAVNINNVKKLSKKIKNLQKKY